MIQINNINFSQKLLKASKSTATMSKGLKWNSKKTNLNLT